MNILTLLTSSRLKINKTTHIVFQDLIKINKGANKLKYKGYTTNRIKEKNTAYAKQE